MCFNDLSYGLIFFYCQINKENNSLVEIRVGINTFLASLKEEFKTDDVLIFLLT